VTRPGIEGGPNVGGRRSVTVAPTEGTAQARPEVTFGCNECNEALDLACDALAKARRLALVVQNALLNADLQRACSVLRDLQITTSIEVCCHGGTGTPARFRFW
jgi:hypothetical protein